jgi:hypothetical protein
MQQHGACNSRCACNNRDNSHIRESAKKSGRPAAAGPLSTACRPATEVTPAAAWWACNSRDFYNSRGGCNNRDKATFLDFRKSREA